MKKIAVSLALIAALPAWAAQAFFTGKMDFVQTVTYQMAVRCQYDYLGQKFYRLFPSGTACPSSVDVQ